MWVGSRGAHEGVAFAFGGCLGRRPGVLGQVMGTTSGLPGVRGGLKLWSRQLATSWPAGRALSLGDELARLSCFCGLDLPVTVDAPAGTALAVCRDH